MFVRLIADHLYWNDRFTSKSVQALIFMLTERYKAAGWDQKVIITLFKEPPGPFHVRWGDKPGNGAYVRAYEDDDPKPRAWTNHQDRKYLKVLAREKPCVFLEEMTPNPEHDGVCRGLDLEHHHHRNLAREFRPQVERICQERGLKDHPALFDMQALLNIELLIETRSGVKEKVVSLLNRRADINYSGSDGDASVHIAAREYNTKITCLLIKRKAKINRDGKGGDTPIHIVARDGCLETLNLLLKYRANINMTNDSLYTPLCLAILEGRDAYFIDKLVKHGAQVKTWREDLGFIQVNPLYCASSRGDVIMSRQLIGYKADVNFGGKARPDSPLEIAFRSGHIETAKLLMNHKAKIFETSYGKDTALAKAIRQGDSKTVILLLDRVGVKINQTSFCGDLPIDVAAFYGHTEITNLLIERKADLNFCSTSCTPLAHAARRGHIATTKLLIDKKANINCDEGNALRWAAKASQVDTVTLLLKNKADINKPLDNGDTHILITSNTAINLIECKVRINQTNLWGETALSKAIKSGKIGLIKRLTLCKASLNKPSEASVTPLKIAVDLKKWNCVSELLSCKAVINDSNVNALKTELSFLITERHFSVVAYLLGQKADANQFDQSGFTCLNYAVTKDHEGIVAILLKHKARVNQASPKDVATPLRVAVRNSNYNMTKLLIEHKARVNQDLINGLTPLTIARNKTHWDILAVLLSNGASFEVASQDGIDLLFNMAKMNQANVVAALLDRKASANTAIKKGWLIKQVHSTLLHAAAEPGATDVLKLLLDRKADPLVKDRKGVTSWDLIVSHASVLEAIAGPRLLRVWEGKRMPPGVFVCKPFAKKPAGCAPGFIAKTPGEKRWLMKLGWPEKSVHVSDTLMTTRRKEHRRSEVVAVKEKIAADLYALLGIGYFYVAKHRLAIVDPINEFSREHPDLEPLVAKFDQGRRNRMVTKCVHLASKWIDAYQNLSNLDVCQQSVSTLERESFPDDVQRIAFGEGSIPQKVVVEGKKVPIVGLIELLAASRLLGDTDVLGGSADNAGFVIERDIRGVAIAVRAVKIDAGEAFSFDTKEHPHNRLLQSFNSIASDKLEDKKDIQFANHRMVVIKWQLLSETQKHSFIAALKRGLSLLRKPGLMKLMIKRRGLFDKARGLSKRLITDKMIKRLIKGFEANLTIQARDDVYGTELQTSSEELVSHEVPWVPKTFGVTNFTLAEVDELLSQEQATLPSGGGGGSK